MNTPEAAALEAARRKVKRANGLLREAVGELAQLAGDGPTVVSSTRVHDAASTEAALERIAFGRSRYGAVDVIVVAAPRRRHHPPKPDQG